MNAAIVAEANIDEKDEGNETHTPFKPLDETCEAEIKSALKKFKNKKAPRPDGIRADVLKLAGETFLQAYQPIPNYCLRTGYFPRRWKHGE